MPEPPSNNVKQTPGRRRPGPNAARSAPRKNYASENDAAGVDRNFRPDFGPPRGQGRGQGPSQGPTTPKKAGSRGPGQATPASKMGHNSSAGNNSNRRSNNRSFPKNISTSPAPSRVGRHTPPQTAGAKSTGVPPSASGPAFAGPTFHASPAASSLPLPSFLSKQGSPGTPRVKSASGLSQVPSPPASDSELPANHRAVLLAASSASAATAHKPRDESPLDIFFNADRAEKEKARRASSANLAQPFSPPAAPTMPLADGASSNTFPAMPSPHHRHHHLVQQQQQQQQQRRAGPQHMRHQSAGFTFAELDGTPGRPIGPAFATPFHERIRAVRPNDGRSPVAPGSAGPRDLATGSTAPPAAPGTAPGGAAPQTQSTSDRSEALMRFLFSGNGGSAAPSNSTLPPGQSGPSPAAAPHPAVATGGAPFTPTRQNPAAFSQNHAYSTPPAAPAAPVASAAPTATNISAMEDSLRQILKLDSPFGVGSSSPGYGGRS